MNYGHTITGKQYKWILLEKMGEGDAGEVYLVESLLGGERAILKRPRKSTFSSEVLRQAAQIRTEGSLLKALRAISYPHREVRLSTPTLLDQSPPEEGFSERFFIVIGQAAGFNLKWLLQLSRFGQTEEMEAPVGEENDLFLRQVSELGQVPDPVLVRALIGVIHLLETIHFSEVWNEDIKQSGMVWNDVKPEHLYWDPRRASLTVIDWGNGNFLEADGVTKDRQHSSINDYYQFIQEMGSFLAEASPDLYARLGWPQGITPGNAYSAGVKPLKRRLSALHKEVIRQSKELRNQASALYALPEPGLDHLTQSDVLLRKIVALGEIPDFPGAANFAARIALHLASENELAAFQQVCERTAKQTASSTGKWMLLAEIAGIALRRNALQQEQPTGSFAGALSAGVADDWPTLLWNLFEVIADESLPDWWEDVTLGVRRVHLNLDEDVLSPYVAVSRLFYTLQAEVLQSGDKLSAAGHRPLENQLHAREDILKIFSEEVVKKWKEIEPAPPHSGIGYDDIDGIVEDIELILPGTQEKIARVLAQPKAHAEMVLNAWERKDFETARLALRMLLVWDPYRRRLLQADRIMGAASQWLANVRHGAGKDEPFYDYLTSVELAGRNLRNRVGPAKWLDGTLDALKMLRKGTRPADLLITLPQIHTEIPWLNEYRSREVLSLPRSRPLTLERDEARSSLPKTVTGTVDGKLGIDMDMQLAESLDTWVPEARGSSARVFAGYLRNRAKKQALYAIKVMRPDRIEYALPLFREEAHILSMLRDVPGVTPLVECGFLRVEDGLKFPAEERHDSALHLRGHLIRYGVEEVQNYLASLETQVAQGWLPYLALVHRDQQYNLMKYCDAGYTHGWFLPLSEGLLLAIQICDILQYAHDRNIVYRDHKILHYYWDLDAHGVIMIDWNIAKRHSQGLAEVDRQFDLVQFGARALHHILTGRPAPGALPLGPNRPEEIEQASLSYPVQWTYDDERLPLQVKDILERVLNQGFSQIRELRADLVQVYQQIPALAEATHNSHTEG